MTQFFTYDEIVYRLPRPGAHFDRWNGEEWITASGPVLAPSEEEYLRMREIDEAEADRLRVAY